MTENSRTLIPCRFNPVTALRSGALLAIAATTASCMLGPDNGDVDRRPAIQNAQLAPFGYSPRPSPSLSVQILSSGSADPTNNASWQTFGTAISGTQPNYFFA